MSLILVNVLLEKTYMLHVLPSSILYFKSIFGFKSFALHILLFLCSPIYLAHAQYHLTCVTL